MPDSQNSNRSTNSTLTQLLEIDSQLSSQEAQLKAQLESLQHKRNSLQVVISLFNETAKYQGVAPTEKKTSTQQVQAQQQPQSVDEYLVVSPSGTDESPSTISSTATSIKAKKTTTSTKKKSQTRKTQSNKKTKPVVGWQQYLREEFRNSSLSQAISTVLHSQAERVWDIAAVVDAIFVEEIPQEVRKKVQLQITNLLATGARENKWYREQQGFYTLSGKT